MIDICDDKLDGYGKWCLDEFQCEEEITEINNWRVLFHIFASFLYKVFR